MSYTVESSRPVNTALFTARGSSSTNPEEFHEGTLDVTSPSAGSILLSAHPTSPPIAKVETATHLADHFSMLHSWVQFPSDVNGRVAIFDTPIAKLSSFIIGHSVCGHSLCPASVYHELALAGAEASSSHLHDQSPKAYVALRGIDYATPLVHLEGEERVVRTTIVLDKGVKGTFEISSQARQSASITHCTGKFKFTPVDKTTFKFQRAAPSLLRQISTVVSGRGEQVQIFNTRTAYEIIFPRVVTYSKEYHTIKTLVVDEDGMDGYALVSLPKNRSRGGFVVHPIFMDTMLHVAGFVANMQGGPNDAYICSQVDSVKAVPSIINNDAIYGIFIRNAWMESEGVMVADATAVEVVEPRRIVAQLKGMHFRKLRLDRLTRALTMAGGHPGQAAAPKAAVHLTRSMSAPQITSSMVPSQPSHDIIGEVTRIVGETCQVTGLDSLTDLATYGVDSLMSIEIFSKLQSTFTTASLDRTFLANCTTIFQIAAEVRASLPDPAVIAKSTSISLRSKSDSTPSIPLAHDVQARIIRIVGETCGIDPQSMVVSATLESYGVDSLMSIEIFHKLTATYPKTIFDPAALSRCDTIASLAEEVKISLGDSADHSSVTSDSTVADGRSTPNTTETPESDGTLAESGFVKPIIAQVLGISVDDIEDKHELESLGFDSLSSLELRSELEKRSISLPTDVFVTCRTVNAVETLVSEYSSKKQASTKPKSPSAIAMDANLRALQKSMGLDTVPVSSQRSATSGRSPLFLIHDGSGLVHYIRRLLPLDRDVWGIHNPYLFGKNPWDTVEDMAAEYAGYVKSTALSGPVIIGGWSFGGVVAFEAAQQLMRIGFEIAGVVLIDSPTPINHVPLSQKLIASVVNLEGGPSKGGLHQYVKNQFVENSRMLGHYHPRPGPGEGPFPPITLLRCTDGFNPEGVPDVPLWLADRSDLSKVTEGWSMLVGAPVKTFDIPGNHFQPFKSQNINALSKQLGDACEYLDSL